jgi:hypothetical protein
LLRRSVFFTSVVGFLVAAPIALAETSTQLGGYPGGGVAGAAENQVRGTGSGTAGEPIVSGTLPFTGLNLVLLVVGGTLLVMLGIALMLRGRSGKTAE